MTPAHGPHRLGLTGSIGMGKSTVAAMLRDCGVPVFDADAEVHHLQGPEGALVAPIEAAFPGTSGPQGVDRTVLGARVWNDGAAMARLEALVHPAVAAARAAFLAHHAALPLVVYDIPLLFERDLAGECDSVAVVTAPPAVQAARVLARPGMTPERLAAIRSRQWPDADKRARADHVIDNGGTLDETRAQVARLVARLRQTRPAR